MGGKGLRHIQSHSSRQLDSGTKHGEELTDFVLLQHAVHELCMSIQAQQSMPTSIVEKRGINRECLREVPTPIMQLHEVHPLEEAIV